MLTRKDYVKIAEVLKASTEWARPVDTTSRRRIAEGLCVMLKADNKDFDSERFKAACGIL